MGGDTVSISMIDVSKHDGFRCMVQDARLLLNMLEQSMPGHVYKDSDFIQPGLLAGQTKMSVIEETSKSILNHIAQMNKNCEMFL